MSLPENFLRLFKEKRFPEIIYIVRALWNREGWLYLKRNKNAVDRVKRARVVYVFGVWRAVEGLEKGAHKEISQRPARTRADRQKKIETLRTIEARLRNQGYSL